MNHERASTTWDHVRFALGRRPPQPEVVADEPEEAEDGGSGLALFVWGALTALVLWWLYLRPGPAERRSQPAARSRTPPAGRQPSPPPARAAPQRERAVAPAAAPTAPEADDLTLVYGIGPARAARLREAGITTFAALAVADAEQLRDILVGVGVGVGNADVSSWPQQAALAARGDWDGLETYQEQLREERG